MQPSVAVAITENAVLAFVAVGIVQYGILAGWANVALASFSTVVLCVHLAHGRNWFGR